jgi:trehalose synthase
MNGAFLRTVEDYEQIVGHEVVDQLYQLAEPLKNMTICHVNSTASGGGVAEILSTMVPLTRALGIETRWEVIQAPNEFFAVTKSFHNGIQGDRPIITSSQLQLFQEVNKANAETLRDVLTESQIVVIHDPQPIAMIKDLPNRKGKWIWRCHVDASRPFRPVWKFLDQYIQLFDASIYSLAQFAHPSPKPIYIIPPSIDPLSDKNIELEAKEINQVHETFGLDPNRPLILQVSRFDRFKDPVGVIEAYRMVKRYNSSVQLVLAGGDAKDDPEGDIVLQEVRVAAAGDPDIHILALPGDAHRTINALQSAADIVLQKSVKEGFGLTVTEALWKSKPVIGGSVGGIRLQVINWQTGFLVNTPEGAAYRMRYLLQRNSEARLMGERGRQYVREKFLITRHLRDYLSLFYSLQQPGADRIELPKDPRFN